MPRFSLPEFTNATSHEPSLLSGEGAVARESQPHAGAGGIAPVSVTSATPEVLGLSSHPAGWASSGSQLHPQPRSPRATVSSGGDAHGGAVPGSSSSGAKASISAGTSTATSTSNHLDDDAWLQEILTYDFLYKDLSPPKDPPASAAPAATTVVSHDPQPGTSAASTSQGTSHRVSLEAVMKRMALKAGRSRNLKRKTPSWQFEGERLPVRSPRSEPRSLVRLLENREFAVKKVAKVLMGSGYRIDHWDSSRSPVLDVTEVASEKKYRVLVQISTQNRAEAPKGGYVKGVDVLAHVTVDRGSQTLKSLHLFPLES
jgi:hypothetical protein